MRLDERARHDWMISLEVMSEAFRKNILPRC
jgi:hypothetical protein